MHWCAAQATIVKQCKHGLLYKSAVVSEGAVLLDHCRLSQRLLRMWGGYNSVGTKGLLWQASTADMEQSSLRCFCAVQSSSRPIRSTGLQVQTHNKKFLVFSSSVWLMITAHSSCSKHRQATAVVMGSKLGIHLQERLIADHFGLCIREN